MTGLLFMLVFTATAQEKFSRFEISLSTGIVFYDLPVGRDVSFARGIASLVAGDLTFRYFPNSFLSVGLSTGPDRYVNYHDEFYLTLTPSVHLHWLRKEAFTLYSGIGYAVPLNAERFRHTEWHNHFQYTPLGATFGRKLFGLAELGFGPRYFPLRLGIGYRF